MKTILTPIISAIRTVILTFTVANFFTVMALAQNQPSVSEVNPELAEILTNAPPPGFATRLNYVKSFTKEKDILDAYHAVKLSKEEAMLALSFLGGKVSMDTYGKVVDQDGQRVVDAKVQANVETSFGDSTDYHTKTDAQGLFHFLGLHGQGLGIEIQKEGYYFDYMLPSAQRPGNYLPDPSNPMVLTMWKLKGAEPMKHDDVESTIPRDGTAKNFNLLTGRKDVSGGLAAQMLRDPLEIAPKDLRKPFNWSVTLSITNGGLLEYTNQPYPYEAPSEGYQKSVTLSFPTNMVGWQSWAKRNYYFKDGPVYGRMTIEVHAGAPTPEAFFEINVFANPNNSRNLEFDGNKQIMR